MLPIKRICSRVFASFFDRVDCNIVEARIHTTRHGYALDSFLVLDPFDMAQPSAAMSRRFHRA